MGKRIVIIRHAKSKGNEEYRFQGNSDTPLSDLGLKQAGLLRERVQSLGIEAVYCSPLMRARQTAEIAFSCLKITENQDLVERGFGAFDGILLDDAKKLHADADDLYHGRIEHIELTGLESIRDLQERSFRAFQKILDNENAERIAIVSHGMWIRGLLSRLSSVPFSEMMKNRVTTTAISFVNASCSGNGWEFEIEEIGNAAHLSMD